MEPDGRAREVYPVSCAPVCDAVCSSALCTRVLSTRKGTPDLLSLEHGKRNVSEYEAHCDMLGMLGIAAIPLCCSFIRGSAVRHSHSLRLASMALPLVPFPVPVSGGFDAAAAISFGATRVVPCLPASGLGDRVLPVRFWMC